MKKYFALLFLSIVICLITSVQGQNTSNDNASIKKTALDYAEGFYSGNADRMENAIHPDLRKVVVKVLPQTGNPILQYSTFSELVELSRAKVGDLAPDKRKLEVTVLNDDGDVACAKLTSAKFNDYLQMAKFGGQWKIVNVLWTPGPDATRKPKLDNFDPSKERGVIESTAKTFLENIYSGDATDLEKSIMPEISSATLLKLPQTDRYMIDRNGFSSLVEFTKAKLLMVSADNRNVTINILDIMDGMAFVKAESAVSTSYFQMQKIGNDWKIINILSVPKPGPKNK